MKPSVSYKNALYREVSALGKAFGHPTRLALIELLAQSPRTVECLSEMLQTPIRSVSQHLTILLECQLVHVTPEGRFRRYALTSSEVVKIAVQIRKLSFEHMPVNLRPSHDLTMTKALEMVKNDALVLIDVRPSEEFDCAHVPGAVNIPLLELEAKISELDQDKKYAAYCRGACCMMAHKAAEIFSKHGRRLQVIEEGMMELIALQAESEDKTE